MFLNVIHRPDFELLENNFSGSVSVYILRIGEGDTHCVGPLGKG
jgi:hypothetical protein